MMDWITSLPIGWAILFLFVVVFCRAQGTYWLGRAVLKGADRGRLGRKLDSDQWQRGVNAIRKWGWPIIPLSFLTIGFQTAVNAGAGLLGMRWHRYTLAALPGYLAWAFIYALFGLAAFAGIMELASRSLWLVLALVLAIALISASTAWVRRRRARSRAQEPAETQNSLPSGSANTTQL